MQSADERAQVLQHLRCLVDRGKGLAQAQIRTIRLAIVLVGCLDQLLHRVPPYYIPWVDQRSVCDWTFRAYLRGATSEPILAFRRIEKSLDQFFERQSFTDAFGVRGE